MSVFGGGDQQNTFGKLSFGATTSTAPTNLTSQASTGVLGSSTPFGGFGTTTSSTPFGGFGTTTTTTTTATPQFGGFGATTTSSTPFGGFGTATTSSTTSLFGVSQAAPTFSSSLFPSATTTTSSFPALGQTSTAQPTGGGFNFGGFGNTSTSTATFGTGSLAPTSTVAPAASSVGLGGVDLQNSSCLSGNNVSNKKDSKAVKETQIPNEIAVTVESFKKYVKEQKAIREEMSRVSSKNIYKVQELVGTLKQQLSIVSNGLHRNATAIARLKEESNQELKNAEIAQRNKDAITSMQYENNASTEYFHNLANSFERQMQSYRQQIEQMERHLLSLSQPYTLTPNEWTAIRKRLHDTFVTLAAQLQTVHQEVQLYKEHFINTHKLTHGDVRSFLEKYKENMKDSMPSTHLPTLVTYGPSPFAAMQSAVGKAITNVFNRSQQLPGGSSSFGGLGLSGFESGTIARSTVLNMSAKRIAPFQNLTPFKPLGQTGVPSFGSDATSFASDGSALNNQKPFQLQKPPAGNKRGKRWTST
ncbi:Nucleoporin p58/p45 [Araneus ventricosus]|uniref:Nucleoporin p58/p45 n=1 Tax=Araneus ventricosus TaxID=182803 RepID=A0A4Y2L0C8_ARAVE|nr:Nucleoporin p58/p45 [Araneus ventricosus]GBN08103.1 Nucleoporin p58/p45 [Araneus ventricosus]